MNHLDAPMMGFAVDIGHFSSSGARKFNEDCAQVFTENGQVGAHGWLAVIADGVSAGGRGAEAAQSTVQALRADYFATPPTWDTTVALDRVIAAHNQWLTDHNRRRSPYRSRSPHDGGGLAMSTVTALVLRGHSYTLAHLGDCRAYLIRQGNCLQLTTDHCLEHPDLRSGLTRALGLDDLAHVDYSQGEIMVGDVFVLVSDGVHQVLKLGELMRLAQARDPQAAASSLVEHAVSSGGTDNASAIVMRIDALGPMLLEDELVSARTLPAPGRLHPGQIMDGMTVVSEVVNSGVHRLYQVLTADGQRLALKTLHESRANDQDERAMLAHEAWLAKCITQGDGQGFVRALTPEHPSAFYVLQEWLQGQPLSVRIKQEPLMAVDELINGAAQLVRALGRLHRLGIIHRDVKPENVHLGVDGRWRLLDLGAAISGWDYAGMNDLHAGTPSYMNPEQWSGEPAKAASDLFALGVTLYEATTRRLPYGFIEPYQAAAHKRDPVIPSKIRPDVPIWFSNILLKAIARDAKVRFETADELLLALERGAARPIAAPSGTPLIKRDPSALLKMILAVSLLLNGLLIYWLLFLPR